MGLINLELENNLLVLILLEELMYHKAIMLDSYLS